MCAFFFMMTNVSIFGWGQQTYLLWVMLAIAMVYPRLVQENTRAETQTASSLQSPIELTRALRRQYAPNV